MPSSPSRLGVINGLRGLAIIAVLLHHLYGQTADWGWRQVAGISLPLFSPASNAWQGVGLFFVLSGFVLFLPYAEGTRSIATFGDVLTFYKRRFLRLYPLYYLNVLISMVFFARLEPTLHGVGEVACMATGLFPYCGNFFSRFNWVLWSLSLEICFSLIFPLLVVFYKRYGMARLFVVCSLIAWPTQYVGMRFNHEHVIKDSVLGRLADFAVGMLVAYLFVQQRLPRRGALCTFAGLALLYLAFGSWDLCATSVWPHNGMAFTGILSDAGFFLVLCGAFEFAPLRRVASNGALQVVGMMCYSLYVWHGIVLASLFKDGADHQSLRPLTLYLFLLGSISALTYRYVEFHHVSDWRKLFRGAR